MFGISGEHLLVLLVILLVFGPKRLPDLGSSLGRTLKNFKDAMNNTSPTNTTMNQASATLPPAGASVDPNFGKTANNTKVEEAVVIGSQASTTSNSSHNQANL